MSLGYASKLSVREDLGGQLGAPEMHDDASVILEKVQMLAKWVQESSRIVAFTGAGISTSCGIPDFRGPNGVWTLQRAGKPPPEVETSFVAAKPSLTHQSLVALAGSGKLIYVCSQNVDCLHQRSGLPRARLAELHGNCFVERCRTCGTEYVRDFEMSKVGLKRTGRRCSAVGCNGPLHDTILDWEDALPPDELAATQRHASEADLALCLGTSLQITPACNLPLRTVRAGGRMVIVNLQATPKDKRAALVIRARVDQVMALLMRRLGIQVPHYRRTDSVLVSITAGAAGAAATAAARLVNEQQASKRPRLGAVQGGRHRRGEAGPGLEDTLRDQEEQGGNASGVSSRPGVLMGRNLEDTLRDQEEQGGTAPGVSSRPGVLMGRNLEETLRDQEEQGGTAPGVSSTPGVLMGRNLEVSSGDQEERGETALGAEDTPGDQEEEKGSVVVTPAADKGEGGRDREAMGGSEQVNGVAGCALAADQERQRHGRPGGGPDRNDNVRGEQVPASWQLHLQVGSVHGSRCPLTMVEAVEVAFPGQPGLRPARLSGRAPLSLSRTVRGAGRVDVSLTLRLTSAADEDRRAVHIQRAVQPPGPWGGGKGHEGTAADPDSIEEVVPFVTQFVDYGRGQQELIGALEVGAADSAAERSAELRGGHNVSAKGGRKRIGQAVRTAE